MSQTIHCQSCNADTAARNIADLIASHTNEKGRFCCARCGGTGTFLNTHTGQTSGQGTGTWFKGIVTIDSKNADAAYTRFAFLTAEAPDGEVTGIAFKYYRNRPSNGDKARRGRPNGGLLMAQSQLLSLVDRLVKIGVVSKQDWRAFVRAGDARVA